MNLKELARHISVKQYLRICERGQIVGIGYPDTKDVQQHANKTVGLVRVADGVLEVNVYTRKG